MKKKKKREKIDKFTEKNGKNTEKHGKQITETREITVKTLTTVLPDKRAADNIIRRQGEKYGIIQVYSRRRSEKKS